LTRWGREILQKLKFRSFRVGPGGSLAKAKLHAGHEKHLFAMVEAKGLTEKMKPLVKNAKHVCICCGRAAAKAENLCSPEPLR